MQLAHVVLDAASFLERQVFRMGLCATPLVYTYYGTLCVLVNLSMTFLCLISARMSVSTKG
jgi:hypothetical protein